MGWGALLWADRCRVGVVFESRFRRSPAADCGEASWRVAKAPYRRCASSRRYKFCSGEANFLERINGSCDPWFGSGVVMEYESSAAALFKGSVRPNFVSCMLDKLLK